MTGPSPLSRAELDFQLSPSLSARDAAGVLARHVAETAAILAAPSVRVTRDLAYGAAPAQRIDVICPPGAGPFPCLAVLHGGFWQEGSKAGSGFAARALAAQGWASALIGYTLAPEATLGGIVAEASAAVEHLAARSGDLGLDPRRIVLAGHSAGAHLAAATLCGRGSRPAAATIAGAVLVSGVYDLAPVAASYVNDLARITPEEVRDLSLLAALPLHDVPVLVMVGSAETDAFVQQSLALAAAWGQRAAATDLLLVPGRDHFDILDTLADSAAPAFRAIMAMVP
ncbi:MAG: alpha/beta hydrolase [Rhodobacteraceae bacterium]|nr:alpha/beta hydrolase [Paracoccaceae bacterium]